MSLRMGLWRCPRCRAFFKNSICFWKFSLTKHEKRHLASDFDGFRCPHCPKTFTQSSHLNEHIKSAHNGESHPCNECGTVLSCRSSWKRHFNTVHSRSQVFTCPVCEKHFSNKTNCEAHLNAHKGEKEYVCHLCSKGFFSSKALGRHKRSQHGALKKHKCPHCPKSFSEASDLKRHCVRHFAGKRRRGGIMSGECSNTLAVQNSCDITVLPQGMSIETDIEKSSPSIEVVILERNEGLENSSAVLDVGKPVLSGCLSSGRTRGGDVEEMAVTLELLTDEAKEQRHETETGSLDSSSVLPSVHRPSLDFISIQCSDAHLEQEEEVVLSAAMEDTVTYNNCTTAPTDTADEDVCSSARELFKTASPPLNCGIQLREPSQLLDAHKQASSDFKNESPLLSMLVGKTVDLLVAQTVSDLSIV